MPSESNLINVEKKHKVIAIVLAITFAFLILTSFLLITFLFKWADWIAILIFSLLLIVPAYISNASMVITGGGKPIDGRKHFRDGRRILGDHKTMRGTLSGLMIGILVGFIQMKLFRGLLLSIGTICGDIIVSFIKRRLNLKPGAMLPIADQLGFIIFAVLIVSLIQPLPSGEPVATILVVTLPIHFLTNVIAWLLKLKPNPW